MPNDAKLGMIVGVGVVIVVAAVFFRKEGAPGIPARTASKPAAVGNAPIPPTSLRPQATKTSHSREAGDDGDRHTVADGDTLFSLAEKYYGDKARFNAIFEANRAELSSPDQLTAGIVLVIPRADSN